MRDVEDRSGEELSKSFGFEDRVVAEAVRKYEEEEPRSDDKCAVAKALVQGGSFEDKVITRALAMPFAAGIRERLKRLKVTGSLIVVLLALLSAFTASMGGVLGPEVSTGGAVNVLWTLFALLGVQMLMLGVWLFITMWSLAVKRRPTKGGGSVFSLFLGCSSTLRSRLDDHTRSAFGGCLAVLEQSRIMPWLLGAASHFFWFTFNIMCLCVLIPLLMFRHNVFAWETTSLSPSAVSGVINWLGAIPRFLGFAVPTAMEVAATQAPPDVGDVEAFLGHPIAPGDSNLLEYPWQQDLSHAWNHVLILTKGAWANLLMWSLLLFGLIPRLLAFAWCIYMVQRLSQVFRLNTKHEYYAVLRDKLDPVAGPPEIIQPPESTSKPSKGSRDLAGGTAETTEGIPVVLGPPGVFGYEIGDKPDPWPPIPAVQWEDLKLVDGIEDEERIVEWLQQNKPAILVMVCRLPAAPDRGVAMFLASLQEHVHCVVLALIGRATSHNPESQRKHWENLARRCDSHKSQVRVVDLSLSSEVKELEQLLGLPATHTKRPTMTSELLESAFATIIKHYCEWAEYVDNEAQAKLHREIVNLYAGSGRDQSKMLNLFCPSTYVMEGITEMNITSRFAEPLKRASESMVGLLPPKINTKWVVAGATAGAFGCLAVASVANPTLWPLFIHALPTWAAVGSAISVGIQLRRPKLKQHSELSKEIQPSTNCPEAIKAAALLAMRLEMQSQDRTLIRSVFDKTLSHMESEEERMNDSAQVRAWLDQLRHCFEATLACEKLI